MKHLSASLAAFAMVATAGTASAQQYHPASQGGFQDYARVIRVDPVYDSRASNRYAASTGGERCTESRTYAGGYDRYGDRYDDRYRDDRYGGSDPYRDGYSRDGYDPYRGGGTQAGSTIATVIGGIVGAAVGSQVGGGSARYATSAIGSMVGGIAGRQVYEQTQRNRNDRGRVGHVIACDPMPVGSYDYERGVNMYDVTYEYGGRTRTTRTSYHPGDRIRVRVDVRPE
jgi:uncharacterized protein YcfJ